MSELVLAEGFYRLKETVKNPERIDKRLNDWRFKADCPVGAEFQVLNKRMGGANGSHEIHFQELRPVKIPDAHRFGNYNNVNSASDWFKALVPHLELVVNVSLGQVFKKHDFSAKDGAQLIAIMLESGKLTMDDVEAAIDALAPLDERPYWDFLKKHGL
jgi:hypothetical protein